jgi:hypothetical protein
MKSRIAPPRLSLSFLLATACLLLPHHPLDAAPSGKEIVRGPVFSGTIRGPRSNEAIAMKGLVVTMGDTTKAYACYDADLLRLSMVWTGDFLELGDTQSKIAWPPPPQVKGGAMFHTEAAPGWAGNGSLKDPRPGGQGPLPRDWAHYEGLFLHGNHVVLQYSLNGIAVLECPSFHVVSDQPVFTRTFQFEQNTGSQTLLLADGVQNTSLATDFSGNSGPIVVELSNNRSLAIGGASLPDEARLEVIEEGRLVLRLSQVAANRPFRILLSSSSKPDGFVALRQQPAGDLRELCKGGPAQWPETVITRGRNGDEDGPYVVDTLTEPLENPWNTQTFFGGFDFFTDGRAAICTFHGDVWIVSGIDANLDNLAWKRYASGLFQPLGLKVVDDRVYVLGRDQITRLHDLNDDGEADHYENFNNDSIVTANYHEFSMDLHTDTDGNFYFAKGAPWEPQVTSPHQGTLLKVSKDGSNLSVVATGFRAPNGMTVGPKNQITVSDNQGHWIPASKLNWVEPGGFYGMTPAAQRDLLLRRKDDEFTANPSDPLVRDRFKFKGWDADSPMPEGYDEPLCWLPMNMDNSSGGQVFVTSDRWGPFQDQLLFMSYGKCRLFAVLTDELDGIRQAAMVQFPLRFDSGIMRGRFNPIDGQLYLCGLKGWQTSGTRDGGFYRVRYTGNPVRMPVGFTPAKSGLKIDFATRLDPETAADPDSYSVERWNYSWSGAYGSPEFSVAQPAERKHDRLDIRSARLINEGRTVLLEIADMKPADQIKVRFNIDAADGETVRDEIYATVYQLHPEFELK